MPRSKMPPVLRLFHTDLAVCTVRLTLDDPVEPLAVLCGDQSGVDKHRFHAQLRRDLRTDSGRHGFVVFVQEIVGMVLVPCDTVIQK